jgi:hypothetical protein
VTQLEKKKERKLANSCSRFHRHVSVSPKGDRSPLAFSLPVIESYARVITVIPRRVTETRDKNVKVCRLPISSVRAKCVIRFAVSLSRFVRTKSRDSRNLRPV